MQQLNIYPIDTNIIVSLNDTAWELQRNKPELSITVAEKIISLTDSILNIKYKSLETNISLDELTSIFLLKQKARALNCLGYALESQSQYANALIYLKQAVKINMMIDYKSSLSSSFLGLGFVHKALSNNTKAIAYYLKAQELSEELNDSVGIIASLINLGAIYQV
ncbi:hypothetical protein JYT51_00440, partial [Candidatus Amoebophilus asiaticus]|nr:hypothetical protein [Candidatus Amoebophilus asiaticus]